MVETMTPKVEAPATPNRAQPVATPTPAKLAKRERKPKAPKTQAVVNRDDLLPTVDWNKLPKGIVFYRKGDSFTVQKGKFAGETRKRTQDLLTLPTAGKLMELNPGMTQPEAERVLREAGAAIKPGVMGEVSRAASNAAFIVRRYANKLSDKQHDISVSLRRVNVESTVAKLAREYGMTEEEVRKRLNLPEAAVAA